MVEVSDLGDLLELLNGAPRSWHRVHLVCSGWSDPDWAALALARLTGQSVEKHKNDREMMRRTSAEAQTSTGLSPYCWKCEAWITEDKQREDITSEFTHHVLRWIGAESCIEGPHPTYVGSQRLPDESGIPWHQLESRALLDPSGLPANVVMTVAGGTTYLGRDAILVRGEPRRHSRPSSSGLWWFFCDYLMFTVDVERGVLLTTQSFVEDKMVTTTVVESIEFDNEFPDSLFEFPEIDDPWRYRPVVDSWRH
jgi:hypothetical protein